MINKSIYVIIMWIFGIITMFIGLVLNNDTSLIIGNIWVVGSILCHKDLT